MSNPKPFAKTTRQHDVYLAKKPQFEQWICTYYGEFISQHALFTEAWDAWKAAHERKLAEIEQARVSAKENYLAMNFSEERANELAEQATKAWYKEYVS